LDIWKWVHGRLSSLYDEGHHELADYVSDMPSRVVDDEFDKMDEMFHSALPLCRSLDDKWLEVYFRHWRLQGHVLKNYNAKGLLSEAISLLDFSHQEDVKDCPQRICSVQDLAACYGIKDGSGFSEERIAVCQETLAQIDGSWPCYRCISGELLDAFIDGGKYDDAEKQLDIFVEEVSKFEETQLSDNVLPHTRLLIETQRYEEAWEIIKDANNPLAGEGFEREKILLKSLCLCLMKRWDEAVELTPTFGNTLIAAKYFDNWTKIQILLVEEGLVENNIDLRQKFHKLANILQEREAARLAFSVLDRLIRLCCDSKEKFRAEIALKQLKLTQGQLNLDLGANDIVGKQADAIRSLTLLPAIDTFETVAELLGHQFENETQKYHSIELALNRWPDDGRLYALKSDLFVASFEMDKSYDLLENAYAYHFGSSELESRFGTAYLNKYGFEKYTKKFPIDKLDGLSKGAISSRTFKYVAQFEDKDPELAIQYLENLTSYWPDDVLLLGRIARLYYKIENYDQSISYRRRQIELDPENTDYKWDLLISATLAQDKKSIVEMCKSLELETDKHGLFPKENQSKMRIQLPTDDGYDMEHYAVRLGPALARITDFMAYEEQTSYGKEVVFTPTPVNVLDQNDEEGRACDSNGNYTLLYPNPLKTIFDPGYKSYPVDGLHPGEQRISDLNDKLAEHNFICKPWSGEGYIIEWIEDDKTRSDLGAYLFVLISDGQQAKLNEILMEFNQILKHQLVWHKLATELGDPELLSAQEKLIEKYGIEV